MPLNLLNPSMLHCSALAAGCVISIFFIAAALVRLSPKSKIENRKSKILLDTDGTATIEFALVLPILGFMVMMMAQVTFLMAGNLFVNYAAFAATRSAIVQIPSAYSDDPANQFTASAGMSKYDAIQHAAAFALVPVAGRQTTGGSSANTTSYVDGLTSYYTAYGATQPPWINALAADRLRYALDNTSITVMLPQVNGDTVTFDEISSGSSHTFKARDPITVMVTHRLNLSVPYINRIFADGQNTNSSGRYRLMYAQYTLTNEGILDTMPPQPTIPRQTP